MNHNKRLGYLRRLRESLVDEAISSGLTNPEEYATMELIQNNVTQWPGWMLRAAVKGC